MIQKIVAARPDPRGAYDIFDVRPVPGAQGGGAQARPPFSGPAATAANQVAAAGHGQAFAVDLADGYAHVYVRVSGVTGPVTQTPSTIPQQPTVRPTVQPTVRPTVQPTIRPTVTVTREGGGGVTPQDPTIGDQINSVVGILSALGKLIGSVGSVKDWAKMSPNSNPERVYQLAQEEESNLVAIGGLLQGIPDAPGVYWMGKQQGGRWFVPVSLAPDPEISPAQAALTIDPTRVFPLEHIPAGPGTAPGPGAGPILPNAQGQIPYGSIGTVIQVPPVRPRQVIVRRCGKGMQLAIDGGCYPKGMLKAHMKANRSKKAPVSWRDAQQINKGRKAEDRIARYAKERDLKEHTHRHRHRR